VFSINCDHCWCLD